MFNLSEFDMFFGHIATENICTATFYRRQKQPLSPQEKATSETTTRFESPLAVSSVLSFTVGSGMARRT